eukprot:2504602-Rhodomonas_salina.1
MHTCTHTYTHTGGWTQGGLESHRWSTDLVYGSGRLLRNVRTDLAYGATRLLRMCGTKKGHHATGWTRGGSRGTPLDSPSATP